MGNFTSSSGIPISVEPFLSLGTAPQEIEMMACGENSVLIINSSNTVEIRNFDGTSIIKPMNLKPSCCCATHSGGWIIGFTCGHLSEFDASLNLIVSYRTPGEHKAHDGSVLQVSENSDYREGNNCHLISLGSDNTLKLWGPNGHFYYLYQSKYQLTSVCSSPFFTFLTDDHCQIHIINADTLNRSTYKLPSSVRSIEPLGEGFSGLAILENNTVCILSVSDIITTFQFLNMPDGVKLMPLVVEEQTGLITYAVLDKTRNLTLRALEKVIFEAGKVNPTFCHSSLYIVAIEKDNLVVYKKDSLETASMFLIQEVDLNLPRKRIVKFFRRID